MTPAVPHKLGAMLRHRHGMPEGNKNNTDMTPNTFPTKSSSSSFSGSGVADPSGGFALFNVTREARDSFLDKTKTDPNEKDSGGADVCSSQQMSQRTKTLTPRKIDGWNIIPWRFGSDHDFLSFHGWFVDSMLIKGKFCVHKYYPILLIQPWYNAYI